MSSGRWTHDLYEARGNGAQTPRDKFFYSRGFRGKNLSGRIPFRSRDKKSNAQVPKYEVIVTNLHWNVTANDVTQLASAVGNFRSVMMDYDESGRSTGRCTVRFDTLDAALLAAARYNGRELDNRPMQWTLVPSSVASASSTGGRSSIFDRLGKRPEERLGPRYDSSTSNTRGSKTSKESRPSSLRWKNKNYTSMDLDAEIDEYMNNDSSNNYRNNTSSHMTKKNSQSGRPQQGSPSKQRMMLNYEEGSVPVPVLM